MKKKVCALIQVLCLDGHPTEKCIGAGTNFLTSFKILIYLFQFCHLGNNYGTFDKFRQNSYGT